MTTKREVFLELLEDWRQNEDQLIQEFSIDFDGERDKADQEKRDWLRRYDEADYEIEEMPQKWMGAQVKELYDGAGYPDSSGMGVPPNAPGVAPAADMSRCLTCGGPTPCEQHGDPGSLELDDDRR